jgi:hypothetical protein
MRLGMPAAGASAYPLIQLYTVRLELCRWGLPAAQPGWAVQPGQAQPMACWECCATTFIEAQPGR